jgi:hypothetical protein
VASLGIDPRGRAVRPNETPDGALDELVERFAADRTAGRANLLHMTDEEGEQGRADRDHERSEEAHWRVAEAGAQEEGRPSETARQSDKQKDDWENEGGAFDREPKETTDQG